MEVEYFDENSMERYDGVVSGVQLEQKVLKFMMPM
jgi:hypothetical protein